ncbi:MAG TPA: DUF1176 domain-containing protein [Sphingobium sp.]
MTRPLSRFLLVSALLLGSMAASAQTPPLPAAAAPPSAQPPAPAAPALGRLRIFDDWAVACDNRLSCSAVSLLPQGAGEAYSVLVWIGREGGPDGESTIELSGAYELRGKIDLFVDNEAAGQLVAARDMARATGPNAFKLIRRLGSSYSFDLREGKTSIAAPSLSGLAQALRYMDEQQGRVGSEAALAAIGDKPAGLARPVPEDIRFPLAATDMPPVPPAELSAEEQQAARTLAKCGGRPREFPVSLHPLDGNHILALVACDAGTDNVSSIVLVGSGGAGTRSFQYARFDYMPGFTGEPGAPPLVVNAQWNPVRSSLSSFARGRPLGDCGTSETYIWDGTMFRLAQARAMPVCRGAWEWPVLWSASPLEATPVRTASSKPVRSP